MEKVLYIDEKRAATEFSAIEKACEQVNKMFDFIASKGIIPNRSEIENIVRMGNFSSLIERYRAKEFDKIKPFMEQYGDTPLTDDIDSKIYKMTDTYKRELLESRKMVHIYALDYFEYLDFGSEGVSIKQEYNLEYFQKKYSVILSKPEHFEFYDKHVEACRLLNELADHSSNEFEALDRLFHYSPETKEFELNIEVYYPNIHDKPDPKREYFLNGKY